MNRNYVLITPAHNEEDLINEVIESVLLQTEVPRKWLIVDDASTDRTGEIIKNYAEIHKFIEYLRLERDDIETYYSRRTCVFLAGYEHIKRDCFDFVGALDADLILPPDYYKSVLDEFSRNSSLGIASGVYINKIDNRLESVVRDHSSTPGGLQMFRRACYEAIGGYRPMPYGGDDSLADTMSRMNNWQTYSFPQYQAIHLRPVGCRSKTGFWYARFRQGLTDYTLGTCPLFMIFKCLRRTVLEKPYLLASFARQCGYYYGCLTRPDSPVPKEVVRFLRTEQRRRLFCHKVTRKVLSIL